ncbi:M1 family metallopeptidase [Gluconacetobacter diazotrophicus]|uniref:Aminopeptidase n=1 Tax=Gluconacetobacter diazotrophicus (strain ATCC 49037 / DSM 5601 / CCUG 37298 / CIP 103539 / LMG 7603 / PAl5) TaxID=272568 RepID=A9HFU5_GLUDA|nr:M1 family metallopeptidase [Gluconacetobacter diazotrophicus]CAP55410.1 Aminopeptidase [Gluconacetobacter diazotrophicus PA1 5]
MNFRPAIATLLLAGTALLSGPAFGESPFDFAHAPGQLPKIVVPSAYRIDLVTDMKRLTLRGHESIDVDASAPTDSITLNQAGLTLTSATLDGVAAKITQDDKAQTATLTLKRPLAVGHHTLAITYHGPIPATPNGIYYDDYRAPDGKQQRMLVTQFEVADARRMFPGWDEPSFKATFQLTATLPKASVAISNMPIVSTSPAGGQSKRVVFGTTPRMSTYLLALVAGDVSAVSGKGGDTPINVYAPTGEQQNGSYALTAASQILPYYNEYFGVAYPLPKMDLIAIPGNYEAGAMENWGAITFIDDDLLFDPKTSAPTTQEIVYIVVAHEMAHQWSGDLVTMGWWDNIWLNEGFATWMEAKATDHFNPTWQMWPRQHTDREQAMAQDAHPTTHPVQQVIHDVSEANTAFDRISYQKGEQVIRMIEDWLGPDTFRDGMRTYMKTHAYGNTTSADLWAALAQTSHQDVATVARSFTEQPGIPLVTVARRCEAGKTTLSLTEGRFAISDPHPLPARWNIPVTVGGPGIAAQRTILTPDHAATLTFDGCDAALKANLGENGYYRTQYDTASLAALKTAFAKLGAADRANLLGDQFALFQAGLAPLSAWLDLVAALPATHEDNIAVWSDTIAHLKELDAMERGSPSRPAFRAFARALLGPQLARLGWTPRPGESFLDSLLRPSVIATLGQFDDAAVVAEAQSRFAAYRKDPASLPPSLVAPVTWIVGRHADAATYATLAQMLRAAGNTEDKLRYFDALAASSDPALIRQTVQIAYSGVIPNGRVARALAVIAARGDDPDLVFKLVQAPETQKQIRSHLAPWSQSALLPAIAGHSVNPAIAKALMADPSVTESTGATIEAKKAVDLIAANADIAGRAQAALTPWLAALSH